MADTNAKVERGATYDHEEHGEIVVTKLIRRIDAVDGSGVVDDGIIVRFMKRNGRINSANGYDQQAYPNFVDAVNWRE